MRFDSSSSGSSLTLLGSSLQKLRGFSSARPWTARRACAALLLAVGLLWLVGAAAFLAADGTLTWTLPRREQPPAGEHNLASYRWGPTLRASSYHRDPEHHHHPLFLVDEQPRPRRIEKWTSSMRDAEPWIEIRWREPRQLSRVVIRHAGWREDAKLTLHQYRLWCLSSGGQVSALWVRDNRSGVATHQLPCRDARGLRIVWSTAQGDQARVYEVEAWGR